MKWSEFWQLFTMVLYLLNLVLAIYVSITLILKKQDPVKTLSWVLVIIMLPYVGLILYILFGRNFRKEKIFNRKGAADLRVRQEISRDMLRQIVKEGNLPESLEPFRKLIVHNLQTSYSLLTTNNEIDIYFSGKDALISMYDAILNAKEHIHLQSYIIVNDQTGDKFKELLIKKAKEGLEVRVMYDSVGCWALPDSYVEEMKNEGIEIMEFSKTRFLFPTTKINYRNHRKILVVDGKIGFLGGVNIADRYFNGGPFEEWRDTHLMIKGEAVYSLQASFLLDRFFMIHKNLGKRKKYYPDFSVFQADNTNIESSNPYFTQIISSGPDSDWSAIMQCYFLAITQAKRNIYIVTPYFTPSESILNAIKITSLSGVEISIMLPERSDTMLTHWGTMSYISELLEANVKIYLFKRGFNHSKVISIDGEFCIVGSANMDNRSFEHNFEITSVIYNKECTRIIEKQFNKDKQRCHIITQSKWKNRSTGHKIKESIARLGSPLL